MFMKTNRGLQILAAALLLAFVAPVEASDDRGTAEEAQAMVANAIAYYDERGAEAALAKFNVVPAPEFMERDLYIFVWRGDAVVAHAVDSSLLGRSASSFTDVDGKEFGAEMVEAASADGAWVDYKWKNPATGEIEQKSSWVVLHDGHIFGVGIYKP